MEGQPREQFFFGNGILAGRVPGYPLVEPTGQHRLTPEHTVDAVLEACSTAAPPLRWTPPTEIENGADVMVGYLLLDAWIGNTDRHDENWGWLRDPDTGRDHLTPTYDHASSLGRNEPDEKRAARLAGRDPSYTVAAYAARARSAFYASGGAKPLTTLDAFRLAADRKPGAAALWRKRLEAVPEGAPRAVVERVPDDWMSAVARRFTIGILNTTRQALLTEDEE